MKKLLIVLILLLTANFFAQEYHVDQEKENIVKFISDAPLEDFEGVTDNIDGYMYLKSLEDLSDNQLYFEVDLTTLDTGIDLRNRHMRDNYLETDKYRFTFYEGRLTEISPASDSSYNVKTSGKLIIHGVTNDISVDGKLIPTKNGFKVETNFSVALTDYNIDIPQVMFMKIDENMKLQLEFYLKEYSPSEEENE